MSNSSGLFLSKIPTALLIVHSSYDVEIPAIVRLIPCLNEHGFENPIDASHSAFDYTYGTSFFDWMKENPATLRCFDSYMAGRRIGKSSWLDYYPIEERLMKGMSPENENFVVDIGGGQGHDLKGLSDKYGDKGLPGRLILQDLVTDTREDGSAIFESMVHNFFDPQPVKGASHHSTTIRFHTSKQSPHREVDADVLSHFTFADRNHQSRRPSLSPPSHSPRLAHPHMPHYPLLHR